MLWTLQLYIFREMGKTFLLTAVGLMVILGLGGGILNMIELDQVTAWQMIKLMGLILPVSLALTLPIAALFSAATAYGRLSADNEFVACRSGGVNILRLFTPAVLISLVSAATTFAFINFFIPGLIKNLDYLIRRDLEQLVVLGLNKPGGFSLGKDRFRCFAEDCSVQVDPDDPTNKWVQLKGVTFVETDGEEWKRSGSAEQVVLSFDRKLEAPAVTADMYGISFIDHQKHDSVELEDHQRLGPYTLPRHLRLKVKWLDLSELVYYRKHSGEWPKVQDQLARIRVLVCGLRFYDRVLDELANSSRIRCGDESVWFEIQADSYWQDPGDGRVHFQGNVVVEETSAKGVRAITGDRAVLIAEEGRTPAEAHAYIELFDNVTLSDPADPGTSIRKVRVKLDPFPIDSAIIDEVMATSGEELLSDPELFPPSSTAARKLNDVVEERDKFLRKIDGVLHSRFAFSASVLVLVTLAAALGIIFRGAHLLTAFGIAFVPTVFVIVTIIAGRQMAEKPGTGTLGLVILWAGIMGVAVLDWWVLFRVLRR
ncbi:MAG: LptF/LptG family permease [Phycisphaerae bacterium]|nr:LptF/LptG family permease [Phycisphaerae bacterium]